MITLSGDYSELKFNSTGELVVHHFSDPFMEKNVLRNS